MSDRSLFERAEPERPGRRELVSLRTPDNHLFKVYSKLGIAGRAELPARLRLYKALHHQRGGVR